MIPKEATETTVTKAEFFNLAHPRAPGRAMAMVMQKTVVRTIEPKGPAL